MSTVTDLVVGLAQHLHDHGVGVYRPDGKFNPGETGIIFGAMPDGGPDRCIALMPYPAVDTITGDATTAIQARTRGDQYQPLDEQALADDLYQLLHAAGPPLVLGGVRVSLCWRASRALLGRDGSYRHEGASNFYFQHANPTPHTR